MASFSECWGQLKAKGYKHANGKEVLTDNDKQSILDRTETFKKEDGLSHDDAIRKSIQEHHDEAHAQVQSIHDQLGIKPAALETAHVPKVETPVTAEPVQKESGTVETPPTEPPTGTGISSERFTEAYGDSAPVANTGKGAGAWKDEGLSRLDNFQKTGDVKDDPYSVLTNLREGRTPVSQYPSDVALLGSEHQRLLEAARSAEGTPEYAEKSQAALSMAEAIKEVAHGPASDVFRSLQEYDKPRYDNVTDFDQALREREKRESTPTEKVAFKKMADDVASTRDTAAKEVSVAQAKLGKFPKMGFDDAAQSIRDQFSELTKNCGL